MVNKPNITQFCQISFFQVIEVGLRFTELQKLTKKKMIKLRQNPVKTHLQSMLMT